MTSLFIFDGTEKREMNSAELAQYELDQSEALRQANAQLAKSTQKQAVLDRLGITADEAQLLLG